MITKNKDYSTQWVYAKIDAQKRNFNWRIQCWIFLRHCLAWFRMLGYLLMASCGTLGFRGTPVENHYMNCRWGLWHNNIWKVYKEIHGFPTDWNVWQWTQIV